MCHPDKTQPHGTFAGFSASTQYIPWGTARNLASANAGAALMARGRTPARHHYHQARCLSPCAPWRLQAAQLLPRPNRRQQRRKEAFPCAIDSLVSAAQGKAARTRSAGWLTAGSGNDMPQPVGPYKQYTGDGATVGGAAGSSTIDGTCLKCHVGGSGAWVLPTRHTHLGALVLGAPTSFEQAMFSHPGLRPPLSLSGRVGHSKLPLLRWHAHP